MTAKNITTTLTNGAVVLAKVYDGRLCAKTFANRTQARLAAENVGGDVCQWGRPFYVRVA